MPKHHHNTHPNPGFSSSIEFAMFKFADKSITQPKGLFLKRFGGKTVKSMRKLMQQKHGVRLPVGRGLEIHNRTKQLRAA